MSINVSVHAKTSTKFKVVGEARKLDYDWSTPYSVLEVESDEGQITFFASIEQLEKMQVAIQKSIEYTNKLMDEYNSQPGRHSVLPVPSEYDSSEDYPF